MCTSWSLKAECTTICVHVIFKILKFSSDAALCENMYQSRNQTNLVTGKRYLPPLSLQWYKDHGFVCTGIRCPPLCSRVFSKHVMAAVCVWPTSALLSQNMLISSGAPGRLCVTKCLCSICSPSTGTHTHTRRRSQLSSSSASHQLILMQYGAQCTSRWRGRIMLWKANVIGLSTVLYNAAMD